jgi:hypothetical protein
MTDAELSAWWPELGDLVSELRRIDESAVADALVTAVAGGATSSGILGRVGAVLRDHQALRARLSDPGSKAWKAVLADVDRAFPGAKLTAWISRLKHRLT